MAYPSGWADSFGSNFYRHAQARELATFDKKGIWNTNEEGQPFSDINVKIIMNTFAHIKMYIFNLQQASYGLLIYKTFLKLKLHGNDEGFYPKLHLQQLHHKKYHPMN